MIATARRLAKSGGKRPRQADLRRAVSTAYYAMFHHLARTCADLMVGGAGAERSKQAWTQVYRALEHGFVKNQCKNNAILKLFPKGIEDFGNTFITLQEKRHQADYDPDVTYTRSEVEQDIILADRTIEKLAAESTKDRRAFAAFVLFKKRPS